MKKVIKWFLNALVISTLMYLGIWVMLIGGIAGLVDQYKAESVDSTLVAVNFVKILFFEVPIVAAFVIIAWTGFSNFVKTANFNFKKRTQNK